MSPTEICQRALQKIGTRSSIASLTEASNEARACAMVYESTRDEVLSMANWDFAKRTATLGLLKSNTGAATVWDSTLPAPPWLFEYAVPSDCVRFRYMVPQGSVCTLNGVVGPYHPLRFEFALDIINDAPVQVLLTNIEQAIGVYTARVADAGMFSPAFTEALSSAVAAKIVQTITGEVTLRRDLYAAANAAIVAARVADANEGLTILDQPAEWMVARGAVLPAASFYPLAYGPLYPVV